MLGWLLSVAQAVLGARVVWRLVRTGGDAPLCAAAGGEGDPPLPAASAQADLTDAASIAIVVPVLNEAARLAGCLDGLLAQGAEVAELLIVDGGSSDGTPDVVAAYARRDPRLRLVLAGPAPPDWNGKVWGLHAAEQALGASVGWVLTLDADVRPAPALARTLRDRARSQDLRLLSVATPQRLSGAVQGLLHPALLATLVYRFGRPGHATRTPAAALANGQCCLIRRDLLSQLGGFQAVRLSLCEDVTLARLAARAGDQVGFYEADRLVEVSMYADWQAAWRNWPRSLTTRDALFGVAGWLGLLEVTLVQALPLPLLLAGQARRLNLVLSLVRLGMLFGMARAYPGRPSTYWLSPALDGPAAFALWRSALARRHAWRGRIYARQKGRLVAP